MGNTKRSLSDEELGVMYSLYDYCGHRVSLARRNLREIFGYSPPSPYIIRDLWKEEGWEPNHIRGNKKKRELGDEELSVIYSLYDYCNHSVSKARLETKAIFGKPISPIAIRDLWKEEEWSLRNRGHDSNSKQQQKDEILSIIYSLYDYCDHDLSKASRHLEILKEVNIRTTTIGRIWKKEGWRFHKYLGRGESYKFNSRYLYASKVNLNAKLTLQQEEKMDRLFEETKGNARIASNKLIDISPQRVWNYWVSQRFVRGKYHPVKHINFDDN